MVSCPLPIGCHLLPGDVRDKPADYAALGIPEYWRFDETGESHGTRLAGDRLVGDRYEPICGRNGRRWMRSARGAGIAVDEWPTGMGSGLDFKRPVFHALMDRIGKREPGLLPMAHKDRLCRFGFDWFEYLADSHGCGIRVVNQPSLSPQAEWVEDPVAVVHAFSGRLSGLRRYRKQIREAATDG